MSFSSLGPRPELARAVSDRGYGLSIPIQAKAFPLILDGRDPMDSAQTGTGKTTGFTPSMSRRLAARLANGS